MQADSRRAAVGLRDLHVLLENGDAFLALSAQLGLGQLVSRAGLDEAQCVPLSVLPDCPPSVGRFRGPFLFPFQPQRAGMTDCLGCVSG